MRFYIGFDIGDAESIIEMSTSEGTVQPATMPGENASGRAIPTLYAVDNEGNGVFARQVAQDYADLRQVEMNFKRRPCDLITITQQREIELLQIDPRALLNEPEFQSGPLQEYAKKLCTFVNIVMNEPEFLRRAEAMSQNCVDCEIYVGHPTNWSDLDCHIYLAILLQSDLGQNTYLNLPMKLLLESESRAAFLYIRNAYAVRLVDGEFVALMDVGSSTIDISVLTKTSRNYVYNSGSNYLGARSIDYLILQYYIDEIERKTPEDAPLLRDILKNNEAAFRSLLLNCRFAKESIFSSAVKSKDNIRANIFFGDFDRVTLTWNTLVDDICARRPIAGVLEKYCGLPHDTALTLGQSSWIDAFRDFLRNQLDSMEARGINVTKLFLTGSASRMGFVREICREMVPALSGGESLFDDTNPSNAIAEGLTRVGISEYKAKAFNADMKKFFDPKDGDMYRTVRRRIPDLIADLTDPITNVIQDDIVIPAMRDWKAGRYKTLRDMMAEIENNCKNPQKFNKYLSENASFKKAVNSWMVNKVGHDLAVSLQGIAQKHGVFDFDIDQLNAFKTLTVNVGDKAVKAGNLQPITQIPADQIAAALTAVIGIVSYLIVPYIIGFVLGIISTFFENLAFQILAFLWENPWAAVAFVAAIAALLAGGVWKGYQANKDRINQLLLEQDFPKVVRDRFDINKLAKDVQARRDEIASKIEKELNTEATVDKLGRDIFTSVYSQVEARANQIKYEIESR